MILIGQFFAVGSLGKVGSQEFSAQVASASLACADVLAR